MRVKKPCFWTQNGANDAPSFRRRQRCLGEFWEDEELRGQRSEKTLF